MSTETDDKAVETRAEILYEKARQDIEGRPAWGALDPNDPYDMGMRATALEKARESLAIDRSDAAAFPVRVFLVEGIRQHPHAEGLTLVKLRGHDRELVANKTEEGAFRYEAGVSLVVLLPVNAILPRPVLEEMGAWDHNKGKGTLGGNQKNRVQARKFPSLDGSDERYESRGALRPCLYVTEGPDTKTNRRWFIDGPGHEMDVFEGTIVQEYLGITRHVAA